jgi:hypothetical protein
MSVFYYHASICTDGDFFIDFMMIPQNNPIAIFINVFDVKCCCESEGKKNN